METEATTYENEHYKTCQNEVKNAKEITRQSIEYKYFGRKNTQIVNDNLHIGINSQYQILSDENKPTTNLSKTITSSTISASDGSIGDVPIQEGKFNINVYITEVNINPTFEQLKDLYGEYKDLKDAWKLGETAQMILHAQKLKTVLSHLDEGFQDFFSTDLDFLDYVIAGVDTDLGHWVRDNSGEAFNSLGIILDYIKNGEFWSEFVKEGKTMNPNEVWIDDQIDFAKKLTKMFTVSLVQGSKNMVESAFDRYITISGAVVNDIIMPTVNKISAILPK